jgi:hypothetical protein
MNSWSRYRKIALLAGIVLLAVAGAIRLTNEYSRLLFNTTWFGANDLTTFYNAVHGWFSGQDIYAQPRSAAAYPPATFVMLWPLLGWLNFSSARLFFALLTIPALVLLVVRVIADSGATSRLEKTLVALIPLSMNATGVTIGNGQITLFILVALIYAFAQQQKQSHWMLTAILFVIALMKPSIAIAFAWLFLLLRPTLKQVLVITGIYLLFTVFAMRFQQFEFLPVLEGWMARSAQVALEGGPSAYGNLHTWLSAIGLDAWIVAASLLAFLALGAWIFTYRNADVWILAGVTGIFARIWTYHRIYDDLLILLPIIALFRITKRHSSIAAGLLLAFAVILNLARLNNISPLRYQVLTTLHVMLWIALFLFLHHSARKGAYINR